MTSRAVEFWSDPGRGTGICLLFAAFISILVLDVFGGGHGFWGTIWALLMHTVPTALILIALGVGWRWEWIGAVLFAGLGAGYLVAFRGDLDWITILLIPGPLFLLAALFLLNWLLQDQLRARNQQGH